MLPLLDRLHDVYPLVAIVLGILVLVPLPVWAYQLRWQIPAWLETMLIWHASALWGCFLACMVLVAATGVHRWVS